MRIHYNSIIIIILSCKCKSLLVMCVVTVSWDRHFDNSYPVDVIIVALPDAGLSNIILSRAPKLGGGAVSSKIRLQLLSSPGLSREPIVV